MFALTPPPRKTAAGQWALSALCTVVLLAGLTGCATTAQNYEAESGRQPGTIQDDERQRLAHTRLQLGAMHLSEGRHEIALGEVSQALQAYPNYPDAYNLRGWIYLSQQEYIKADASFDRALSLRPTDPDTRYNLGWSQCLQKKFDTAQMHFDVALQDPRLHVQTHARTLLAKAVCLRDAGQGGAQVLALLTQAYELDAGNPAIGFNYAQALFENGDLHRARFYARRLNQGPMVSAASLWLGVRIERRLGDSAAMRELADDLERRFPASKEWQKFERGAFDE